MSEGGGSSAASRGGRMRLSPCLMPWFASLVWVQLGCVCCITAMMVIIFVLLYWGLPRDEDPTRPLTLSANADQTSSTKPRVTEQLPNPTAKPASSNATHPHDAAAPLKSTPPPSRILPTTKPASSNATPPHYAAAPLESTPPPSLIPPHSNNSHLHHPTSPPNPLPSTTTHALLSTTITTSHAPLSTTITGSHNRFTNSLSAPSSLTTTAWPRLSSTSSQEILPLHADSQARLPPSASQSKGVPAEETDNSETTFSGKSSSGTRRYSLSSASPEGRPSTSLVDLKSHIREMLSKVREIDTRFVRRDEVVVRRVVREGEIAEQQEEEQLP